MNSRMKGNVVKQGLGAIVLIELLLNLISSAVAFEYFPSEEAMIDRSPIIAVVNVQRTENTLTKASPYNYTQISDARVEKTLKGDLPQTVKLYGGETLLNVAVQFPPGRYIVFLRKNGELVAGAQRSMSARPIRDSQVLWHVPGKPRTLSWQPLDAVLTRIQERISLRGK